MSSHDYVEGISVMIETFGNYLRYVRSDLIIEGSKASKPELRRPQTNIWLLIVHSCPIVGIGPYIYS